LIRQSSKEEAQMANKYMKKSSTFLSIKEMQIKMTLKLQLTLIGMAIIQKASNNEGWQRCKEKETFISCW
jgi:hypothetical protein